MSSIDVEIVLIFANTAIVLAVEVEDSPGTRSNIKKLMLLLVAVVSRPTLVTANTEPTFSKVFSQGSTTFNKYQTTFNYCSF